MRKDRKVTIELIRMSTGEYGWHNPESKENLYGFDTLQEMLSSFELLTLIQKTLGADSVPEYVMQYAKERDKPMPITEEMIEQIKKLYPGVPFIDRRTHKKKPLMKRKTAE